MSDKKNRGIQKLEIDQSILALKWRKDENDPEEAIVSSINFDFPAGELKARGITKDKLEGIPLIESCFFSIDTQPDDNELFYWFVSVCINYNNGIGEDVDDSGRSTSIDLAKKGCIGAFNRIRRECEI